MTPENIKVGDTVHVRGVVDMIGGMSDHGMSASEGLVRVEIDAACVGVWVSSDKIVAVESRPLVVGNKVLQRGYYANDPGVIAAIDEGRAWVRLTPPVSGQSHYSDRVSNLVRA